MVPRALPTDRPSDPRWDVGRADIAASLDQYLASRAAGQAWAFIFGANRIAGLPDNVFVQGCSALEGDVHGDLRLEAKGDVYFDAYVVTDEEHRALLRLGWRLDDPDVGGNHSQGPFSIELGHRALTECITATLEVMGADPTTIGFELID